MPDYYAILGLQPGASEKEIKAAYRKKALATHPDHGGDEEEFKKVNEAYEVLTGKRQSSSGPLPNDPFSSIYDFMNNMNQQTAGQWKRSKPPSKDQDIYFEFRMSADELKAGGTLKLAYKKSYNCNDCNGEGGSGIVVCGRCQGQGQILHVVQHAGLRMQTSTMCSHCHGEGKTFESKCEICDGHGWTGKNHEMLVDFKLKENK